MDEKTQQNKTAFLLIRTGYLFTEIISMTYLFLLKALILDGQAKLLGSRSTLDHAPISMLISLA